jgi:hypothetical protein
VGTQLKEQRWLITGQRAWAKLNLFPPMPDQELVVIDGVSERPFCKMGTDLASLPADELGRIAVQALC